MTNRTRLGGFQRKAALASALTVGLALGTAAAVLPTATAAPVTTDIAASDAPLQTCGPAQVRAAQRWWAFGNNAGFDFGTSGNTATPITVPGATNEGSTVVSDTDGQLQFWSNGSTIFNRNYQQMPNGGGLTINASATQTVASFPSISHPGTYFVVTTTGASEVGGSGRLYYSRVDMNLDGGKGDVTSVKNVPLGGPLDANESLAAVPNADGDGFWVLTGKADANKILAYEFDGDGPVTGTAVESTLSTNNGDQFGTINISPDLSEAVQMTGDSSNVARLRVLDINGRTGILTEKVTVTLPNGAGAGSSGYSADFSPSGDYIYATKIFNGGALYRYKLAGNNTAAAFDATREVIADGSKLGTRGGQVRRAPDGKMYVASYGNPFVVGISNPDATSPVVAAKTLGAGRSSTFGLPQTVTGCSKPNVPPTVDITGPADGATYFQGEAQTASYSCSDPDGTVESCTGPVPNGSKVDTSTPGEYEFTVTAVDSSGATVTKTVKYRVVPTSGICRGKPLDVLNLSVLLPVANAKGTPCVAENKTLLKLNESLPNSSQAGPVGVLLNPLLNNTIKTGVINGTTTKATNKYTASATVDSTSVSLPGLVTLDVTGVYSEAASTLTSCSAPAALASGSKIASLTLNGKKIVVGDQPITIPLVVGNLYINQRVTSGNTVTQRAVFLDLPGTLLDVTIAEATAGVSCNA